MQLKHPELLYALFLLLIPIFIHLFQLRRFQRIDFTNVAFLKKVTLQTRKSSQLKKWLTLFIRLFALACLIIAFAQPFTASKTALNKEKETVLYIDNSFSMEAKGNQGPLLQRALQDVFEQAGSNTLSWFTNDFERKNASISDFKSEILSVPYSQKQLTPEEVLLKANQLFSKNTGSDKRLIFISDFQQKDDFPQIPEAISINAVQLNPVNSNNISIDSAYIESKVGSAIQLNVAISNRGDKVGNIPVSLFKNDTLLAKTGIDFSEKNESVIPFNIETVSGFNGKLELLDPNLSFDNTLFFSINAPKKIKVLTINEADAGFLQKLFLKDEFEYVQQNFKELNYNIIPEQNFIILNEVNEIPASLSVSLKSFSDNGGSIFIVPPVEMKMENYNSLISILGLGTFSETVVQEKNISKIVFSHPLYENVFEKEVVNFQFPKVNSFSNIISNATAALAFEDGKPFLLQNGNTYLSTASINNENSNFQNSPLIVPTLLNMAQQSLPLPRLYYSIGKQNTFAVPVTLQQDEILKLKNEMEEFIPLQQTKSNYVTLTTAEEPAISGTYQIQKENETLEAVSYNYDRTESELSYANVEDWNGAEVFTSVENLFETISEENSITGFWKWFAIFALIFLIFEMLILKYFP